jgi:hypothetical protein
MKPTIKVDLQLLQDLVDQLQISQEWSGETPFFTRVTEEYNKRRADEYKPITAAIIRLRKMSGLITTTVKPGKKGIPAGDKITKEHQEKLQTGRKKSKTINPFPKAKLVALQKRYKNDKIMLAMINGYQKHPTFKKLMKINCGGCMGGFKQNDHPKAAVKNCSSPLCFFYEVRGWK